MITQKDRNKFVKALNNILDSEQDFLLISVEKDNETFTYQGGGRNLDLLSLAINLALQLIKANFEDEGKEWNLKEGLTYLKNHLEAIENDK